MKRGDKLTFTTEVTIASVEVNPDDENMIDIVVVITDPIWPVDKGAPRLQSTVTFPKETIGIDPVLRSGVLQISKRDVLYYSAMGILSAYRDKLETDKLMMETKKLASMTDQLDKESSGVRKKVNNPSESKVSSFGVVSSNHEKEMYPKGDKKKPEMKGYEKIEDPETGEMLFREKK